MYTKEELEALDKWLLCEIIDIEKEIKSLREDDVEANNFLDGAITAFKQVKQKIASLKPEVSAEEGNNVTSDSKIEKILNYMIENRYNETNPVLYAHVASFVASDNNNEADSVVTPHSSVGNSIEQIITHAVIMGQNNIDGDGNYIGDGVEQTVAGVMKHFGFGNINQQK